MFEPSTGHGLFASRGAAAQQGERNFNSASGSFGSKHIVNRPAKLVGDGAANHVHAVAGFAARNDHGSPRLPPFKNRMIVHATIERQTPLDRHPPEGTESAPCFAALVTSS